jgi:hypothetical protein
MVQPLMLFAALTAQKIVPLAALPVGSETRTLAVRKVESERFCRWTEPRQNGAVLVCARHDALLLLVESQKRN